MERSEGSPELPIATSTFRTNRSRPMRFTGLAVKRARNPASSSAASSARRGALSEARGAKAGSLWARANLFQGQTARQSSQP